MSCFVWGEQKSGLLRRVSGCTAQFDKKLDLPSAARTTIKTRTVPFINQRQSNTINHCHGEKMKLNKLMMLGLGCLGLLALFALADAQG